MPRTPDLSCLLLMCAFVAGCGGKIAPDPNATPGDPAPASSRPDQTAVPGPAPASTSSRSVADACGVVCDRKAQCGALQDRCAETCASQIGVGACAPAGNAYIQCWADSFSDQSSCLVLPPVCEQAYCAFTRCAGIVVPDYCR